MRTQAFVLLLALTISGCGGSGKSPDTGGAPRGTQTGASVVNQAPGTHEIAIVSNPSSSRSISLRLGTSLVDDGRATVSFWLRDTMDSSSAATQALAVRSREGVWNPLEQRTVVEDSGLSWAPCASGDGWVWQGKDQPTAAVQGGMLSKLATADAGCPVWSRQGVAQFATVQQEVDTGNEPRLAVSEISSAGVTRSFNTLQIPALAGWAPDGGYAEITHASKDKGIYLWSEHGVDQNGAPRRRLRAALLEYPLSSGAGSSSIAEIGSLNAGASPCANIAPQGTRSPRGSADAEAFTNGGRTLLLWSQSEAASPTCAIYAAVLDSSTFAVLTPATVVSTVGQFASTAWGSVGNNGDILVGWLEDTDRSDTGHLRTRTMSSASTVWGSTIETVGAGASPSGYYAYMIAAGENGTIAAVRQRQIEILEQGKQVGDMDYYVRRFVPGTGWSDETLFATGAASSTGGQQSPGWLLVATPSVDSRGKVTVGYAALQTCSDSACSPVSRFHLFTVDLD